MKPTSGPSSNSTGLRAGRASFRRAAGFSPRGATRPRNTPESRAGSACRSGQGLSILGVRRHWVPLVARPPVVFCRQRRQASRGLQPARSYSASNRTPLPISNTTSPHRPTPSTPAKLGRALTGSARVTTMAHDVRAHVASPLVGGAGTAYGKSSIANGRSPCATAL